MIRIAGWLLAAAVLAACRDGSGVRHGVYFTRHPDGSRESMEVFVRGYREGYALRWHPNGRLSRKEHFTAGRSDEDALHWDDSGRLVACRTPEGADCRDTRDPSGEGRLSEGPRKGP